MKRILFVDDEPMILAGLQNLLRRQRSKWDMVFVESGDAALQQLEKAPFDVIVSDMRMPKMDGATLLKEVQRRYPHVVRIVLSGHAELETALRTVTIAHQFLNKPCDATTLQTVVDRACSIQALLVDDTVRAAVGTIKALPSVPRIYMAVTKALEDPDTSIKEVARLVEQDMAVSAKVLQLVNSAFFGLPQRIAGIQRALSYLGVNMLKRVLLSVETFSMFEKSPIDPSFSLEVVQAHAMTVAIVSSKLLTPDEHSEDAFMAGVLHDVGKLIMAVHAPAKLKQAMALAAERGQPLYVVEQELYGVAHAQVGAYLLGLWGLPFPIVEAVAYHHEPFRVEHHGFEVVDAVHVADALVNEAMTPRAARRENPIDSAYLEMLGVANRMTDWRNIVAQSLERAGRPGA